MNIASEACDPAAAGATGEATARSWAWMDRVESTFERVAANRLLVLVVFSAIYLPPTMWLAKFKVMWEDEFFTYYLSRTDGWSGLLEALATGADQHPPSFYYFTHLFEQILGASHLSLRMTAIVGVWLLCACLYEAVGRVVGRPWGVLAMLLPLTCPIYYYASEARGYGAMMGFAACSYLAWMLAARDNRRPQSLALLAISLMLTVCSHYYGVLTVLPLGVGEVVRTAIRRRLDIAVWVSFLCAALPLVVFLPVIRSAQGYSTYFWAKPAWSLVPTYFSRNLSPVTEIFLGATVVGILLSLANRQQSTKTRAMHPWNLAALCSFCALPLAITAAAKLLHLGFTDRYVLISSIGAVVLICFGLGRITGRRPIIAVCAVILCLIYFSLNVRALRASAVIGPRQDVASEFKLLNSTGASEIAVAEVTLFHRLSFYTPREFARKLTYVSDPRYSIKYLGHDTIDRGLVELSPWFPLRVELLESYMRSTPRFLMYGYIGGWTWLTFELPSRAREVKLLVRNGDRLLFSVEGPANGDSVVTKNTELGAAPNLPQEAPLFSKMPVEGPSLCELQLPVSECLVLR